MGNKVRCKFCKFEEQSKCAKKRGAHTKVNKKRVCAVYEIDEDKTVEWLSRREDLPTTVMPRWAWSKKEKKAEREKWMQQYQTTVGQDISISGPADPKHPSTGDLSRFIGSTIEEEK